MDFTFIKEYLPLYETAAKLTVSIGLIGVGLSIISGIICAMIQYFKIPVLRQFVSIYIEISRSNCFLFTMVCPR